MPHAVRTGGPESVAAFNRRLDRERAVPGSEFQPFWYESTRRRCPSLMALYDAAEVNFRSGARAFYFRGRRYRLARSKLGQLCVHLGDVLVLVGTVGEPEAEEVGG